VADSGVSGVASTQAQEEYDAWLRADIVARLANPDRRLIPHDEVMADLDKLIDEIELTKSKSM